MFETVYYLTTIIICAVCTLCKMCIFFSEMFFFFFLNTFITWHFENEKKKLVFLVKQSLENINVARTKKRL